MRREYDVHTDIIETIVGSTPVMNGHAALLSAFASRTEYRGLRYVTSRDHWCAQPAQILDRDGLVVATDYREWVQQQLDEFGGDVPSICRAYEEKGYLLAEVQPILHYFVQDRGGEQANFVQFEIWQDQLFVERELFAEAAWRGWGKEATVHELRDGRPGLGYEKLLERRNIGEPTYRLGQGIDIAVFTSLVETLFVDRHRRDGDQLVHEINLETNQVSVKTLREFTPGYDKQQSNESRFFRDWTESSAGAAGERVCTRWVFQTSDWTDPRGSRSVSFIPVWGHNHTVPALGDGESLDPYLLFGRLRQFAREIGTPFAWYFYGLHGNLVQSVHIEKVFEAAERGLIVLPENDFQVLRRWHDAPYGF